MSNETEYTVKAIPADVLPYAAWVKAHWSQLPGVFDAMIKIGPASGVAATAAAIKAAIDTLVPILADFPGMPGGPAKATNVTHEAVQGIFDRDPVNPPKANGEIIKFIIQDLPAILAFIQQIIPLFKP